MIATPIQLPAKPRIKIKEQQPDLRQFSVIPIRAITDRSLTEMQFRVLAMFCAYCNRGGLTWVGLQRIADHFGITLNRAAVHTRALIAKGYIKVLYQGFRGERAHTRQVVFNASLSVDDITAITGEKAPYMLENQQLMQTAKGEKVKKRKQKVTDQAVSNLKQTVIGDLCNGNEVEIAKIKRIIGNDLFEAVMQNLPADASPQQIEAELQRMLG